MATTSTNFISALGGGSGIDVKALAQGLVDAEKVPQKTLIDKKIAKSEARISGLGAINFIVKELKTKFSNLDDQGDFSSLSINNTQPTAMTVVSGSTASPGVHEIEVLALAKSQRNLSAGFAQKNTPLNGGAAFELNLSVGGGANQTIAIAAADATPEGIVLSINQANKGIKAQLINSGTGSEPYKIMVTGATGTSNSFTLSSATAVPGLDFGTPIQAATNASIKVDGVSMQRASNTIDDALIGIKLNLTTTTTTPAVVGLDRDTSALKTKVKELVSAYNDIQTVLNSATDKDSTVEGYGASLFGESAVNTLRGQIRNIFTGDSSTPGSTIRSLRDLGVSITRDGTMELTEAKLDAALETHYEDIVTMLSNNRSTPTTLTSVPSGLAGDAVKKLHDLTRVGSTLTNLSTNAQAKISEYKKELTELEDRMSKLLTRYTQQFGAMESIVGRNNSTKEGLKSTFEGMMNAYK